MKERSHEGRHEEHEDTKDIIHGQATEAQSHRTKYSLCLRVSFVLFFVAFVAKFSALK